MAYRLIQARVVVADDSNLEQKAFDRSASVYQTRDLEVAPLTIRVGPSDSEAAVSLGTITTAYGIAIFSDYPIRVRLNGASETQFILTPSNVTPVNLGAPLPTQCMFIATAQVTSLRVEPIASAAQTATVYVVASGDPTVAY